MNENNKKYDAAIIGGGHNGLVCAFYLAQAGLKTVILERSSVVGGAAITEEFHPGFQNSVASYTVSLLQPRVIKDMALSEHGLKVILRKIDNYLPAEGNYLLAGRGGLTKAEIARHNPKDAAAYDRYQHDLRCIVDYLRKFLLVSPPNAGGGVADVVAMLKMARISSALSLEAQRDLLDFFTKSAAAVLDNYFENDLVKALFGFDAIVGHFASPYEPGSAYVLLHHVFGEAAGEREAWGHAIGGMGAITQAMKRACEGQGVEIRRRTKVGNILPAKSSAKGSLHTVVYEDDAGQTVSIEAPIVCSSVHPQILFQQLLSGHDLPADFKRRIAGYQSHSGTFRMNLALERLPQFVSLPSDPKLRQDVMTAGIIMAPSLDYMDRAWRTAVDQGWSEQPIIEMLIPSTLDDSLAPAGQHVASLFCQQFQYQLPGEQDWPDVREQVADHIIQTVDRHAPGFAESVIARQVLSPYDLEQKFALIGGDIFHGKMTLDQLFSARPVLGNGAYRSPIKGIYMCGSGTHPGGGVTGAPGHNAAHQVLRDRRWKGLI